MGKLNQVIAVVTSKKKLANEAVAAAGQSIQKETLFEGISRTYTPRDEEGERFPAESKSVQTSVDQLIETVCGPLTEMFDTVLTQETANQAASGALELDGRCLARDLPVTYLLFLEKQLNDLIAFINKLPVLNLAEDWQWDDRANRYASAPSETVKTKKVPRAFVKYEATKEHPAQVEMFTEDTVVGSWKTIKFSGALKASDKAAMLDRARRLHEAVVTTREACNSIEATQQRIGRSLLDFVFKGA